MSSESLKVSVAAILGIATPGANHFLTGVGPVLNLILTVGQIAVAVISTLYIYSKWKNRK